MRLSFRKYGLDGEENWALYDRSTNIIRSPFFPDINKAVEFALENFEDDFDGGITPREAKEQFQKLWEGRIPEISSAECSQIPEIIHKMKQGIPVSPEEAVALENVTGFLNWIFGEKIKRVEFEKLEQWIQELGLNYDHFKEKHHPRSAQMYFLWDSNERVLSNVAYNAENPDRENQLDTSATKGDIILIARILESELSQFAIKINCTRSRIESILCEAFPKKRKAS